jgi:stearoyl-CoA desaturase (delta-9 desaturase)
MSVDQGLSAVGGGSADASPGLRGRPATAIKPCDHETLDRIITGLVTVVPILLLGLAAWQAWSEALRRSDLAVLGLLYVLTALGITVGFHRLLTHRSFATKPWLRGVFAALGSAAI